MLHMKRAVFRTVLNSSFLPSNGVYHRNLIYKMGKSGVALFSEMRIWIDGLVLTLDPWAAQKNLSRNLEIYRPHFENTCAKGI